MNNNSEDMVIWGYMLQRYDRESRGQTRNETEPARVQWNFGVSGPGKTQVRTIADNTCAPEYACLGLQEQ